ncbi:restriction endonuclease subunit S [Halomonas sp. SIMBA_159]
MVHEGWTPTKLGHISSLITSGSRDWAKFYSDTGSKFIRMTNLRRDGIHLKLDDLKFVNIESGSADGKRTSLQAGDILISITAELGKIGWVPPGLGDAYINQHTALVRVLPTEAEPKFVAYLLASKPYHRRINALNDAGAKAGLNLTTIRSLPLALPDISEQKKIAQILSTWDQAITATERLLENSQQRRKGLMQQLLTGKKRLPGFEDEWKRVRLGSLFSRVTSRNEGQSTNVVTISGQQGLIRQQEFFKKSVASETLDNYFLLKKGQFAYNKSYSNGYPMGAIKRLNRYDDGVVTTLYICFTLTDEHEADSDFYEQYFESGLLNQGLMQVAHEGGRAHGLLNVKPSDFFSLTLHKPNISEQKAIANVLCTADSEIVAQKASLEQLRSEKRALMQQLLTGKRRVNVDTEAA